jgi:hypothetical protein
MLRLSAAPLSPIFDIPYFVQTPFVYWCGDNCLYNYVLKVFGPGVFDLEVLPFWDQDKPERFLFCVLGIVL